MQSATSVFQRPVSKEGAHPRQTLIIGRLKSTSEPALHSGRSRHNTTIPTVTHRDIFRPVTVRHDSKSVLIAHRQLQWKRPPVGRTATNLLYIDLLPSISTLAPQGAPRTTSQRIHSKTLYGHWPPNVKQLLVNWSCDIHHISARPPRPAPAVPLGGNIFGAGFPSAIGRKRPEYPPRVKRGWGRNSLGPG